MADRVELGACDFLTQVPATGDLFLLSNVLHDWNDEQATTILRNCRPAAQSGSRLLVVEGIVPDDAPPSIAKLMDLEMLLPNRRTAAHRRGAQRAPGRCPVPRHVAGAASDSPAKYVKAEAD